METLETFRFPTEEIKLTVLSRDEETLAHIASLSEDTTVPKKVQEVYDAITFPAPSLERPYLFGSLVLSVDGKIAYTDDPQGPLVAAKNMVDPQGGAADFWVLNMLRAYSDCCIIGARTLQAEPKGTSHVFCEELSEARITEMGKPSRYPWNCIVSLDGTDIPFDHMIFDHQELHPMIATSEEGAAYIEKQMKRAQSVIGPFASVSDIDEELLLSQIEKADGSIPVIVTGAGGTTDAKALMKILRIMGVKRTCVESPQYLWHLIEIGLLDEFFINYSSVFVGGPIVLGGHKPFSVNAHPHSKFLTVASHRNGFIFTRQQLIYGL